MIIPTKPTLKGLTLEQERVVRRAVHSVVETVFYDLEQACAGAGEPLDNEGLMECVCYQLYTEHPIHLCREDGWNKEVFEAWRAIDFKVRMRWLLKNFNYV